MFSSKLGFIIIGLILGLFTIPLYRWLLGELSVCVAIPLGLAMAHILYKHTAFGESDRSGRHRVHHSRNRRTSRQRIYINEYGEIFDDDEV